ncbi:carboxyl transferase domain-containing protein, partial [Streptomyces sp. NPDC047028]|uniref:carboxyl transferase domain-containing protein n=1 Tax=Streptomyces sp. NPDC047028 TaxID=3155793 RepID=UPI0033D4F478
MSILDDRPRTAPAAFPAPPAPPTAPMPPVPPTPPSAPARPTPPSPPRAPDIHELTERLDELREKVRGGPSERATEVQHAKGKLTARERLELLFDEGTFTELEALRRHRATGFGLEAKKPHTDGVLIGWGKVYGRT